jgi:S1-C subfamily serine protease
MSPIKASLLVVAVGALSVGFPLAGRAQLRSDVTKATEPAVVMVMAVDVIDGQLVPVASGSGTVVDSDGSVLTNYHVISDAAGNRLYDLFVIGRFRAEDREPEMICAGRPNRSRLKPKLDLALIKCDLDMNGEPWTPSAWPSIPIGRSEDVTVGQWIYVFGYPNVGGTTIHFTSGPISGWTAEEGGASTRAFMKTEAAITPGNSGGTAVDENGKLIGVPTAFRVSTAVQNQQVVTVGKVGLVRPIEHARDLIAVARKGWVPREGKNSPSTLEAGAVSEQASTGVIISSKVVDATNGAAISGASVVILKPGVTVAELDRGSMSELALAWTQTNAGGAFTFETTVPRGKTYAVAVLARGYHPLAADNALTIGDGAPDLFDPWGQIRLRRR